MIDLNLFNDKKEPELYNAVIAFNNTYQNDPENVSGFSYYKLWILTNKALPLSVWKEFQMDSRVRAWYSTELELSISHNIQMLAKDAIKEKSANKQQTLSALLNFQKDKTAETSDKYFIYSFIPLTSIEEHIPNVKIIKTVPKELADAITVFSGNEKN